jgi:phosphoribosylformimino-5-aminoimidazole carboxamide ribotide isomerase
MIVPCIDLQGGKAVQLVRGRRRELAVADVLGLLERFRNYRVIHVIDLDAAMGRNRNSGLIRSLCERATARIRVGGGIRTVARAKAILGWGAEKVIIGSAALRDDEVNRDFLRRLCAKVGRRRVVIALDADGGHIVVHGWRKRLRSCPEEVMPQLEGYCSEFLCTYVDNEGTMRGTSMDWFRRLRRATRLPITAAGGIRSRREVRALARLRMNAAIGMALYRNRLS